MWDLNYYAFHIGDYASHTRHLSLMEDLAYRRLLDLYYTTERALNGSSTDVARRIGMIVELASVEYVLSEFFDALEDGSGFKNKRCDEEIEKFNAKKLQASQAGKVSAERRLNGRSTGVQPTNPNNQEPNKTKNLTPSRASRSGLNGAFQKFWDSYPRKKSKGDAEKAWIKIKPDEQLHDRILDALERAKTSADWQKDGGQFIPYPASWLNAKGWEDEISKPPEGERKPAL